MLESFTRNPSGTHIPHSLLAQQFSKCGPGTPRGSRKSKLFS